ncbi:MAG: PrsW family glutamic-type intramembrane protease, partial [Methanococcaceae archaeon]
WMLLVTIRTIFPAVMHCVSTGILGLFAAMTKFSKPGFRLFYISTGYCIAVLIHFMWNLLVSFSSSFLYGFLFILFAALSFIIIFQFSISRERKIIVRELSEETASDLFPHEHIGIIVSQRRNYPGWIDEKVRKSYVQALITLALRKNQLKTARGRYRDLYLYEIEYYRLYIKNLLTEAV